MKINCLLLSIFFIFFIACSKNDNQFVFCNGNEKTVVSLIEKADTNNWLKAEIFRSDSLIFSNVWRLPYPVYQFDCGDINNDGLPEIAVGVIKTTRYDSICRKRLFIFKLYEGRYIRPLWLGSRVSYPLVDFRIVDNGDEKRFRTIEQSGENRFVVAEYRYEGFGLKWICYIKKDVDRKTAENFFNQ
jgi:hypothetical protein